MPDPNPSERLAERPCAEDGHAFTQPTLLETRDGLSRVTKAVSICSRCGKSKRWTVDYR